MFFRGSIFFLLLIHLSLSGLERQPWFGDVFEFHFLSGYTYSRFRKVEGAIDQLTRASNDHLLFADLELSPSPHLSIDSEIEFTDTPRQSFSFRSYALQGRYLWLDDIVGDPITLATGLNGRFTSSRSLKDVSSPYHGNVDFEANVAIGKEFDQGGYWRFRIWGMGVIGLANKGSPWFEGLLAIEGNYDDDHKWGLFLDGGHGYGRKTQIDISNFYGYGRVRYKYIDITGRYGVRLGVWGTLRFEYTRRLLAKLYPEKVNFFTVSYLLPFSF
ncbi:MAG: hypothetical protein PVI40_01740 [Chlamydiota bacterium]|jgi:hypothetical protein